MGEISNSIPCHLDMRTGRLTECLRSEVKKANYLKHLPHASILSPEPLVSIHTSELALSRFAFFVFIVGDKLNRVILLWQKALDNRFCCGVLQIQLVGFPPWNETER